MTDDRSYDERIPPRSDAGAAREPWYERLLHLFSLKSKESIREDIEEALAETTEDTDVSPKERTMLKNVLGLHRVRVDDVMVPRGNIVAVTGDTTIRELLKIFRDAGHSRLPIYGETLDDAKGMVHIRDVVGLLATQAESEAASNDAPYTGMGQRSGLDLSLTAESAKLVRPVLFAPPSMPAIDLLVRMQATHTHMALVVDEYGGTDGLVTIENLVERVVGEIEDEHDVDEALLVREGDTLTFMADARAKLEEVSEALQVDLLSHDLADDIDTLGGLVTALAGRVPSPGEMISGPSGLEFEVLEADLRRVKRIRIFRPEIGTEGPSSDESELTSRNSGPLSVNPGTGSRSSAA